MVISGNCPVGKDTTNQGNKSTTKNSVCRVRMKAQHPGTSIERCCKYQKFGHGQMCKIWNAARNKRLPEDKRLKSKIHRVWWDHSQKDTRTTKNYLKHR